MTAGIPPYRVYAIKYAHTDRTRHTNFMFKDDHDGSMPMDYFVWAIVGAHSVVVVDTGFDEHQAAQRGRQLIRRPADGLAALGIDSTTVEHVVITHLHYDHCGGAEDFPAATFYLQDREMRYATGRHMCKPTLSGAFDVDAVVDMVRAVYSQRVEFVDGSRELFPGISLHHVGGHTDGMQVVRVWTQRGWLVLASDATHYYANMTLPNPFPIVFNVGDMLSGFDTLATLSDGPDHIIPGHDPLVLEKYPPPSQELEGVVARLDVDPFD